MQSRLVGEEFQPTPAPRIPQHCHQARRGRDLASHDPVVIIATADQDLVILRPAHPVPDDTGLPKIERGPGDRPDLACRDCAGIRRQEMRGRNVQVVPHRPCGGALPREIPVGMGGNVHQCRPVAGRTIVQSQCVGRCNRERGRGVQRSGKSLVPVGAQMGKDQLRAGLGGNRHHAPVGLVEARCATVQRIGAVVRGNLVAHAVQLEPATRNPVGHPPDRRPEILRLLEIGLEAAMPKHHIGPVPPGIGRNQSLQRRAIGEDCRFDPGRPAQRDRLHQPTAGKPAELLPSHSTGPVDVGGDTVGWGHSRCLHWIVDLYDNMARRWLPATIAARSCYRRTLGIISLSVRQAGGHRPRSSRHGRSLDAPGAARALRARVSGKLPGPLHPPA